MAFQLAIWKWHYQLKNPFKQAWLGNKMYEATGPSFIISVTGNARKPIKWLVPVFYASNSSPILHLCSLERQLTFSFIFVIKDVRRNIINFRLFKLTFAGAWCHLVKMPISVLRKPFHGWNRKKQILDLWALSGPYNWIYNSSADP